MREAPLVDRAAVTPVDETVAVGAFAGGVTGVGAATGVLTGVGPYT